MILQSVFIATSHQLFAQSIHAHSRSQESIGEDGGERKEDTCIESDMADEGFVIRKSDPLGGVILILLNSVVGG